MTTQIAHPVLTAVFWIILFFAFITVVAYAFAQYKKECWNEDYIFIKALIKKSKVDQESYDAITQEIRNLEYNNESEQRLRAKLWTDMEWKFRKVSKYKID